MKIKEILYLIEQVAPIGLQESFDNTGVQVGNIHQEAKGALLCIDITEEVIDEAMTLGCNLIIAHHPIAFKPFKSLTGKTYTERCMIKAIQNNIVLYAAHTNLDNAQNGINSYLGKMLNLQNIKILSPIESGLSKLVTFVPVSHADIVRHALFNAGAGSIGNYDNCSFNVVGKGTFRANEVSNPFVGNRGELHTEQEVKIEVIIPNIKKTEVIQAIFASHPYETPAYDVISLQNTWTENGSGIVGTLKEDMKEEEFLYFLKETFNLAHLQYSKLRNRMIKEVAICSGSGNYFIKDAINYGADIFITGEAKYNDFYDVEDKIILTTIGHYESEIYTKNVFFDIISDKFPIFALYMAGTDANPVKYL